MYVLILSSGKKYGILPSGQTFSRIPSSAPHMASYMKETRVPNPGYHIILSLNTGNQLLMTPNTGNQLMPSTSSYIYIEINALDYTVCIHLVYLLENNVQRFKIRSIIWKCFTDRSRIFDMRSKVPHHFKMRYQILKTSAWRSMHFKIRCRIQKNLHI